jgi:hypothetical protein
LGPSRIDTPDKTAVATMSDAIGRQSLPLRVKSQVAISGRGAAGKGRADLISKSYACVANRVKYRRGIRIPFS